MEHIFEKTTVCINARQFVKSELLASSAISIVIAAVYNALGSTKFPYFTAIKLVLVNLHILHLCPPRAYSIQIIIIFKSNLMRLKLQTNARL